MAGRDIKAGQAFVELYTKDARYLRGLANAQRRLQAFGATAISTGRNIMMATAVLASPLILGAKVFADFEKQMANVSTMLDEPVRHMERFTAGVQAMSVDMGESTESLSKGLYDILSASIAPAKALQVLAVSAKAAKAGMTDTSVAADAVTTMLNAYALSADHAESVSDLLFAVVKRGKTTFAELAPSIGLVATNASVAGVSMEELGAAVATLTRAGIKTENAVTSVNQVIMAFLKPSDEAAALAQTLGFEMSTATLKAEGLRGVFERIGRLPPEAVAKLFPNIRALRGVLPILQKMEGFVGDTELMANRAGRTEEAYQKMTKTLSHGFDQAKQAAMAFLAAIGESLDLTAVTGNVKAFLLSMAEWVKNNKSWIQNAARLAVALVSVGAGMVAIGIAAKGMAAAIFLAMNPIVALGGLLAIHAIGWTTSMALTEKSMKSVREEADAVRAADKKLIETLERLAGKQKLTNEELDQAQSIILGLESRYGNLGVTIDETTGKIVGLSNAQAKLNEAMKAGRIANLQAEAMEMKGKIAGVMEEDKKSNLGTILIGFFTGRKAEDVAKSIKGAQTERTARARAYLAQYIAIQQQIAALQAGGSDLTGEAGIGKPGAAAPSTDPKTKYLEKNADLQREIRALMLKDIQDAETREYAELYFGYEKKLALAKKEGRDIALVHRAQSIEERQIFEKYKREREESAADMWADFSKNVDEGANRLAGLWKAEAGAREVRGMFSTGALDRQGFGTKTSDHDKKVEGLLGRVATSTETLVARANTGGIVFGPGN